VQGHVSGSTDTSVSGLRVTLRKADTPGGSFVAETTLDKSGRFQIKGVAAGEYLLESEVAGQGALVPLTVRSGETLTTVLRLAEPVKVKGQVVDRKGNPVPSALVLLWRIGQAATDSRETSTNEQGDFTFDRLAPGNVSVLVQAAGIGSVKLDSVAIPARALHLVLEGLGVSISGTVMGPKGPEAQATVRLGGAGLRTSRSTNTDAGGHFIFQGLGPGDYAIRAGSVILASGTRKVTMAASDVSNFDLTMGSGEVVSGTVIDSQRKPLTGATVVVQSVPLDECPETLSVDVVGYFSTIALTRGLYQVTASMPGFVPQPPQFISVNGRPPNISIQVFRAGRVLGRLLTPSGVPASGAEIRLTAPSGPSYPSDRLPVVAGNLPLAAEAASLGTQLLPHVLRSRAVTVDSKGAFELGELRPGSYGLTAQLEGVGQLAVAPRPVKEGATTDFTTLKLIANLPSPLPIPTTIHGTRKLSGVVRDPKGRALPNTSIAVSTSEKAVDEFVSSISGRNGEFSFTDLPEQKALVLVARNPALGTTSVAVSLTEKSVVIQFASPGGIEGDIVDERGRFVQGAQVSIQSAEGNPGPPVQMSGAGFRVMGVPAGTWTLTVNTSQMQKPVSQLIEVPASAVPGVASVRGIKIKIPTVQK